MFFFAFECRCEFHKTSETTDCKNTISYNAEHRSLAVNAARWWLNQAAKYQLQEAHMGCLQTVFDIPLILLEVLKAEQLLAAPSVVKTDVEILAADLGKMDAGAQPVQKQQKKQKKQKHGNGCRR